MNLNDIIIMLFRFLYVLKVFRLLGKGGETILTISCQDDNYWIGFANLFPELNLLMWIHFSTFLAQYRNKWKTAAPISANIMENFHLLTMR